MIDPQLPGECLKLCEVRTVPGQTIFAYGEVTAVAANDCMASQRQRGLYFVGEVVDVTGWLGGYNFQWAWSSGYAAAQGIAAAARKPSVPAQ